MQPNSPFRENSLKPQRNPKQISGPTNQGPHSEKHPIIARKPFATTRSGPKSRNIPPKKNQRINRRVLQHAEKRTDAHDQQR
uniref:Uncharacterized protein n=1 Tax=Arundo donax TaxID=35708 RepID=A0A0A8YHB3_ARUDO